MILVYFSINIYLCADFQAKAKNHLWMSIFRKGCMQHFPNCTFIIYSPLHSHLTASALEWSPDMRSTFAGVTSRVWISSPPQLSYRLRITVLGSSSHGGRGLMLKGVGKRALGVEVCVLGPLGALPWVKVGGGWILTMLQLSFREHGGDIMWVTRWSWGAGLFLADIGSIVGCFSTIESCCHSLL